MKRSRQSCLNFLTLFSSTGTLICCALPALLISLGLGAVMAGLASNVPGLIWISEHKSGVFIFSGSMLLFNGILLWKNRNTPCPLDPGLRESCVKGRRISKKLYLVSLFIYIIGFFFAYIAVRL